MISNKPEFSLPVTSLLFLFASSFKSIWTENGALNVPILLLLCVCLHTLIFREIPSSSNIGFQDLCSPKGSSVSPDFLHDENTDHWFPGPSQQFLEERTSHAKMALASRWLSAGCFLALSFFLFSPRILELVWLLWFLLTSPVSRDQGFLLSLVPKPWGQP